MSAPVYEPPTRNLALELVRVTEAGALGAAAWVGRGDKEVGDGAAVDDLLDDIAELVLGNKGEVVVVPGDTMRDVVCLADAERGISASKDVDEVHVGIDDDAIVERPRPATIVIWSKGMSEAAFRLGLSEVEGLAQGTILLVR